jgi:hypothetical protein
MDEGTSIFWRQGVAAVLERLSSASCHLLVQLHHRQRDMLILEIRLIWCIWRCIFLNSF